MNFTAENEKDLVDNVFEALEGNFKAPFKVALIGDLGAGKTTLVKGILKKLGVDEPVTSPTFTICKIYKTNSANFQHLDLYRYSKDVDAKEIEEYIEDDKFVTFVEWPENIRYSLDNYDTIIKINNIDQSKREVEIICN